MSTKELTFEATRADGNVSAILQRPKNATSTLVLAHGLRVGMKSRFMDGVAERLNGHGVATLRFNFPYMEHQKQEQDAKPAMMRTVRNAIALARERTPDLPIFAGGKSLGGVVTSATQARKPIDRLRGIVFLGFPLHQPGRPGKKGAEHLSEVNVPMLFLQGSRDRLAAVGVMKVVCEELGERATLQVIEGGDHSFELPGGAGQSQPGMLGGGEGKADAGTPESRASSGRDPLNEIAGTIATWCSQHI